MRSVGLPAASVWDRASNARIGIRLASQRAAGAVVMSHERLQSWPNRLCPSPSQRDPHLHHREATVRPGVVGDQRYLNSPSICRSNGSRCERPIQPVVGVARWCRGCKASHVCDETVAPLRRQRSPLQNCDATQEVVLMLRLQLDVLREEYAIVSYLLAALPFR